MLRSLDEFVIEGITTTIDLHKILLNIITNCVFKMIYSSKKILFFILLINFTFTFPTLSYSRQFLERDYIIIDLKSGVEWLRCSTGQTWNGKECEGQIVRLNFEEIQEALKQANEQLGDGWRLPTKIELEVSPVFHNTE